MGAQLACMYVIKHTRLKPTTTFLVRIHSRPQLRDNEIERQFRMTSAQPETYTTPDHVLADLSGRLLHIGVKALVNEGDLRALERVRYLQTPESTDSSHKVQK